MTSTLLELPRVLITDILARHSPSTSLVTRHVCKGLHTLSPLTPSICIDIVVAEDGTVSHMDLPSNEFPDSAFVRLRTCMQHLRQDTSTKAQLHISLSSILEKCTRLDAIEIRGPLPAILLAMQLTSSISRFSQQVRQVTIVRVHWKWDWNNDMAHTDVINMLSSTLGCLSSLQSLRFQGVKVNTTSLCHLTSVAGGSVCDLDWMNAEYDWKNSSLTRLRSLHTFDICGPDNPQARKLLSNLTHLTHLKLFCSIDPGILVTMTSLVYLHISTLPTTDVLLPSLRHLEVSRLGDAHCLCLRNMTPSLECLEFKSCAHVGDLLANLPARLVSISPMTSLASQQLHHLRGITRLEMCLSCGHTPAMLNDLPLLGSFSLAATDFKVMSNITSLRDFVAGLQMKRLVRLQLVCFDLTDGFLDLSGLTSLRRLELRACTCTVSGLKDAVTSLPELRDLRLCYCSGLTKIDAQDIEHSIGSILLRVEFVGRVPFLPKYRFA